MTRAQRILIVDALREAENALRDYVETLERQGGIMNYGRSVIQKVQAATIAATESK